MEPIAFSRQKSAEIVLATMTQYYTILLILSVFFRAVFARILRS